MNISRSLLVSICIHTSIILSICAYTRSTSTLTLASVKGTDAESSKEEKYYDVSIVTDVTSSTSESEIYSTELPHKNFQEEFLHQQSEELQSKAPELLQELLPEKNDHTIHSHVDKKIFVQTKPKIQDKVIKIDVVKKSDPIQSSLKKKSINESSKDIVVSKLNNTQSINTTNSQDEISNGKLGDSENQYKRPECFT